MREIARAQQGFFPTQDRIVQIISKLFAFHRADSSHFTVLDAGCGTGKAIRDLRNHWLAREQSLQISLLGIESDKSRFEQAAKLLPSGVGDGAALWSAIEDATTDHPVSLLYFNPPFDRLRGVGRMEHVLFNRVKDWPARGTGLLLMIVPDYVLADEEVGLAVAVERDFELLGLWRYPEPEYAEFKQCVLLARRREKALNKTKLTFPRWASSPDKWPVLRDDMRSIATVQPVQKIPTLRRMRLGNEIILDTLSRSPLRSSLLREAAAPAPPIGRPLLPLKAGHLALALAGGLCDGIIESKDGTRFLIKGTLASAVRKIKTQDQIDADGAKTAEIDVYRTRYEMNVRCLRHDGTLENYTSAEAVKEEVNSSGDDVDGD
ncbi:MAG TPA: DUF6094 domain-containing protein [Planctomycetota bacterium]|nr:DUF6094 domain-containing protein [Planctomycetota bacterium]